VRTWDEARVAGYSTRLNGVTGKLVEINTLAENNFLAQSFRNQDGGAGLEFWIGISDSDQRSAIDLVQLTGTEAGGGALTGWHYASGGQITFSNWTAGEPNDAGGSEDATQMYTSGLWNDHQAGSSLGQGDHQIPAIYEFELGLTDVADFVAPGFTVRQVRSGAGVGNLTDVANLLAAGSPNNIGERTMHYSVVNMFGPDLNQGHFLDELTYPFAGDTENFALEATGYVFIPAAGDYTFLVSSDDGFGLTMPGSTLSATGLVNDNGSTPGLDGTLAYNAGRGVADTLGVFNFPTRGFYPIQLQHWEGCCGNSVELSAAPGIHGGFNANFSLVGDIAGLKVFNEIPTALLKSATVTVEVAGVDDAPTVTVGGPYTIVEGQNLALDSVGSDADAGQTATLAYAWDLDNDGQFDDATGANPTVDWNAVLRGLNYDGLNPPVAQTIRVQVTDSSGLTGVATTTVTVSNTAPTLTFNAPLGAPPGQDIDFPYTASDPAAPDAASLTLVVDWGDGASETVNNATAGTLTHAYAHDGNYTITATLTDKDGGEDEQTFDLNISPVFLDADGNLVVNGTSRSDRIILTQKSFGGVEVRLNNVRYTMAPDTNTVIVFAGRGSDSVTVYGRSTLNYILHGEGGNDYLAGGNEDDILDGGDGDDRLLGGLGNDILLGGNGNDRASGASGNDIIYGDGYLDEAGDIDVITDVQALYFPDNFSPFTEVLIFNDGVGRDTLAGDNDDDLIFGGAGNDRINGGNGNDRLWGEDGNDSLSGDNGDDLLAGGEGSDVLYGRAGNDVLIGGNAADRLYGYNGDDLLLGDGLDEMDLEDVYMLWLQNGVYGTQDILDSGSFTVVEDNAVDTLYGQSGADWFVLFNRDVARDARSDDAVDRDPMP
jgi:Ca2+-binding RTX toxin-like protein